MNRNEWLKTLPKKMKWAELGVFLGDFSKLIYEYCDPSQLDLVDTFPDSASSGDKDGNNIIQRNLSSIPDQLSSYFNDSRVRIHKMTTTEYLARCSEKIDCIYIDADHSYQSVKNDLLLSYDVVNNGGLICGHDYCRIKYPGVVQAVSEFCQEKNLHIEFVSNCGLPTFAIRK